MSPENDSQPERTMPEPRTAEDFVHRAWSMHVKGDYKNSEADFRKAMSMDSKSIEAAYGLGTSLKIQGRREDAIKAFRQTLELLKENPNKEATARATMLRQMATTQMNLLENRVSQEPAP